MTAGLISAKLPFAKKKAVEIIKANFLTRDEAARKIPAAFTKYYQESYPAIWQQRRAEVTASASQVLEVWNRNIFPEMKSDLGRLSINIGHHRFPRLLPLSRRWPQLDRRQKHLPGLQRLPQSAVDGRGESQSADRPRHHGGQASRA